MEAIKNKQKTIDELIDNRKEYWNSFYNKHHKDNPTSFALFCLKYLKDDSVICDLGCGNGRDSLFFSKKGYNVIAVDYSSKAIEQVMSYNKENITAICADMSQLKFKGIDAVYSRFSLHSITDREENGVFSWAKKALNYGGAFYIEARSDKMKNNESFHVKEKHYRRFIDLKEIREKIQNVGFQIEYCKEDRGLAIFKEEDPLVIRIIAKKVR